MSRSVSLRCGGRLLEGRLTLGGGRAVLETGGRRIEADVARDGRWIELSSGGRSARVATARGARGIWVSFEGRAVLFEAVYRHAAEEEAGSGEVRAPMTGRVAAVEAKTGATVREGDLLVTIEAMKMEFKVAAPVAGVVEVACAAGDRVELGQVLARVAAVGEARNGAPEGGGRVGEERT